MEQTIKFLEKWKSGGPWILTSIQVDKKSIETQSFNSKTLNKMKAWLELHNGTRNIYFSPNTPLNADICKKTKREEMKSVDWLHVDLDPEDGKDLEKERDRCLDLLTSALPKGVPAPTVIVFSGGGYQGFWKLKESIIINGDLSLAQEAKKYNQQLELLFGADNCHNIDRIMRLPGTVNIPDARKRKKGRTEEIAKVLEFNENLIYDLNNFTPAATIQMKNETGFSSPGSTVKVEITGNILRINDLEELDQWNVPDRVKIIIAQGSHPEQLKNSDNSRSAWVFDCVCQLVRAQVPDDVIFALITDPDWHISESILEQKGNVEKYAIRQIERAKEWAIDPNLVKLNERYAVIGNIGGKCRIIEEVMDYGLKRTKLTMQSFADFVSRYENQTINIGQDSQGNPKTMEMGKWWRKHPKRRQFDRIVFAPETIEIGNSYNLWKGFTCQQKAGDCDLFMDHILRNVCGGNWDLYEYVVNWMARTVQFPSSTGEVAIVLRGGRGVGKSFFAKQFGSLFGRHFLQVSNSSHLVGNFNSHLRDVVVLFADEAFYANDKKHSSVLKTLITEETIAIEAKGQDVETAANCVHLIMASNDTHVIPAGGDERRFLVLDVGMDNQQDSKYFKRLAEFMECGGKEELLYLLMTKDISEFNVRDVPKTDALKEQKILSLSTEEEWWYQKLQDGRLLQDHSQWERQVIKDDLISDFVENAKRFSVYRRGSATSLGRFLNKVIPGLRQKQMWADVQRMTSDGFSTIDKKRKYHYTLPSLEVCRKHWVELFGDEKWQEYEEISENKQTTKKVVF